MCVIFVAFEQHERYPLVLLANRDEFYDRPTLPASRWPDHPQVLAGRDLVAGGTWLGVADEGRFAAVTNYREPAAGRGELSRGALTTDFLISAEPPASYIERLRAEGGRYSGFNLLVGEINAARCEIGYYSNRGSGPRMLGHGIYGLSNHLLNSTWPKVANGTARFRNLVSKPELDPASCFELLADETLAADDELPSTGIGPEREKLLSPIFIRTPTYGTRSSTVIFIDRNFRIEFEERVFV